MSPVKGWALAMSLAATALSCYRPTLQDCTVHCGADSQCPATLTCHDGYCSSGRSCSLEGGRPQDLADHPAEMKDAVDAVDVVEGRDVIETPPDVLPDLVSEDRPTEVPEVDGDADAGTDGPEAGDADAPADSTEAPPLGATLPTTHSGLVLWLDPESAAPPPPADSGDASVSDGDAGADDADADASITTGTDASDGPGVALVNVWRDRSPQHNDATARSGVPGALPWIVPAADGRPPMVELSGDDQYFRLPEGMSDFTAGITVFIVAKPKAPLFDDGVNPMRFLDLAANSGTLENAVLFCRFGPNGNQILYQVFDQEIESLGYLRNNFVANDVVQLLEVTAGPGEPAHLVEFEYLKNGLHVSYGAALVPRVVERHSNLIGRSNNLVSGAPDTPDYHGSLGEIVIYNRALSASERRSVELYLLERWHLP
jgi:hypothetical protein